MVFSEDHEDHVSNNDYVTAIQQCAKLNSSIKWYSNAFCSDGGKQNEHWTSITRGDKLFSLTIYGKTQFKPRKKRGTSCTTRVPQFEEKETGHF